MTSAKLLYVVNLALLTEASHSAPTGAGSFLLCFIFPRKDDSWQKMPVVTLYVNILQTAFIAKCHKAHVIWGKRKGKANTGKVLSNQNSFALH